MTLDNAGHSSEQTTPLVINASASRLHDKRLFVAAASRDIKGSWPTARRFFERGIAQKYRYSSLGLLWAFIPAIITACVLIAGQKVHVMLHVRGEVPAPFYGVFGLGLAQSFLDGLGGTRSVFSSNQMILRRSNIAIEGLIGAAVIDAAFSVLIRIGVLTIAFVFFKVMPVATVPLALLAFAGTLLIGCGIGLVLAPLSSLKRDLDNIMGFLPWILFAITPVFVMPTPGSLAVKLYAFNPLAWIFDSTRSLAYGAPGSLTPGLICIAVGPLILLAGWVFCRVWHPYVVERSLV